MADNQSQSWQQMPKTMGDGEGEAPIIPKPSSEVEIRTMASDLKSIQESGGGAPRPYVPPPISQTKSEPKKEEEIFKPPQIEISSSINEMPVSPTESDISINQKSKKSLFVILIAAILVIGLAALGYFVIYPKLFKTPETPPLTVLPTPPAPEPVTNITPPLVETTPPAPITPVPKPTPATTTEPAPTSEPPPPPLPAHASLFYKIPADAVLDIAADADSSNIAQKINDLNKTGPLIIELNFSNDAQNPSSTPNVIKSLLDILGIENIFNEDLTVFWYRDSKNKLWGGFAAKTNTATSTASETQQTFKQAFEANNSSFSSLLFPFGDPGTPKTWQDGLAGGLPTRYLLFSQSGFLFDYAWVNNETFVITGSFEGLKEAIKRLK